MGRTLVTSNYPSAYKVKSHVQNQTKNVYEDLEKESLLSLHLYTYYYAVPSPLLLFPKAGHAATLNSHICQLPVL